MTDALYMEDCYLGEFEATVTSVKDGKFITLDKTAFYPTSGGQPYDTGTIIRKSDNKEFKLLFCGKFEGEISHQVEEGLNVGDEIIGKIDWDRRYKLMRSHTAAHIISSVLYRDAGALITGNQLETDKSRIDFSLDEFDKDKLAEYVTKANDIVAKNMPLKIYTLPRSDAEKLPEITKLAAGLPQGIENLRIVEIDGYDVQADGGTHVKSTKEVGTITLLKCENKGKNNRRMYFSLD